MMGLFDDLPIDDVFGMQKLDNRGHSSSNDCGLTFRQVAIFVNIIRKKISSNVPRINLVWSVYDKQSYFTHKWDNNSLHHHKARRLLQRWDDQALFVFQCPQKTLPKWASSSLFSFWSLLQEQECLFNVIRYLRREIWVTWGNMSRLVNCRIQD